MGLDDIAKGALLLIGVGLISKKFGAGIGLGELGTGVSTLVAAPAVGVGTGLTAVAGGIRSISETFGDLGRGIGALFEGIPEWAQPGRKGFPPQQPSIPGIPTVRPLLTVGGGDFSQLLTGGGGKVPPSIISPGANGLPPVRYPDISLDPGIQAEVRTRNIISRGYGGRDHLVIM